MSRRNIQNQSGFTIIELLIATVIFALVLLVITTGVLQFTRQYYKGVISSHTQSAARAIADDVTRALQFGVGSVQPLTTNGTSPAGQTYGYCIGQSKRYS